MALPECLFSWQRGSPSAIHVCVLLEDGAVYLSNEAILKFCVGLIAGRLAGKIVRGTGIGVIGDIAIGIVGAFIASWLLPRLGIGLGSGMIRAITNATFGAALLPIGLARA
jgi:uncharacterized membrane protein YeaQ/YmgE (transglycosylase-associated protein family)